MRTALVKKTVRGGQVSGGYSIPAPVGGLNKRDSIARMGELDAILMDNMFPEANDVRVRNGYDQHLTGIAAAAQSLMPYNKPDGTQTLFVAANSAFYNATSAGAVGAAVQSSLTNNKWQSVNFTNSAGSSYLCAFNGADSPRYWDGSSWTTVTGVSTPAITGITTTDIVNAFVHKRRMYLILNNSLSCYYLPVDSVGGAANPIDLGGIASKGGYIVAGQTWTIDAGEGLDDYWVVITSEGQMVVYKGTDPSSSSTWELAGVWNVGEPIGNRCMLKFEGDLVILTTSGIVSVSRVLVSGSTDDRVKISDKISKAISDAAADYGANFGWCMLYYPKQDMLIVNIPVEEGSDQVQYAMNTLTGAWGGPFSGIEANCWALLNEEPYYGTSSTVNKFWADDEDNGDYISFEMQQAFSPLGAPGIMKQIKAVKPFILCSGLFQIEMGVNMDYSQDEVIGAVTFTPPVSYGIWDLGEWDAAVWGGGLAPFSDWQTVRGVGSTMSLRMKGNVENVEFRHQATDVVYERGGIIG